MVVNLSEVDTSALVEELSRRASPADTWGGVDFTAVRVLVEHQRLDIGSCVCGWGANTGQLGQSHAVHVWRALQSALLPFTIGQRHGS